MQRLQRSAHPITLLKHSGGIAVDMRRTFKMLVAEAPAHVLWVRAIWHWSYPCLFNCSAPVAHNLQAIA